MNWISSINVIFKVFHFCQTAFAFLLFYFVLTQLRIISWNWVTRQSRPFNSWADWELRRSSVSCGSLFWSVFEFSENLEKLQWLFCQILWVLLQVHVTNLKGLKRKCGRIQRKNQKSSVIVCRFYIHLFTVSNVNFLSNCCQWKEDW